MFKVVGCSAFVVLAFFAPVQIAAQTCTVIVDFDGNVCVGFGICSEGDFVNGVEFDVSGDPECVGPGGTVGVDGFNPDKPGSNAAMIFDSSCPPTGGSDCSGDDPDLGTPNEAFGGPGVGDAGASNTLPLGNVLIISEDLNPNDPDDADTRGAFFSLDLTGISLPFGPDEVRLTSVTVLDAEANEGDVDVRLWNSGNAPPAGADQTFVVPPSGDNGKEVQPIQIGTDPAIDFAEIDLNGSGAIDDIALTIFKREEGEDGCTPGFWKNHDGSLKRNGKPRPDAWDETPYAPSIAISSVFTIPGGYDSGIGSSTLRQGLSFHGGPGLDGAARILLRAAIASLLNATHPGVAFSMSELEIITDVNSALASMDRQSILILAGVLDAENNEGCPINGKENGNPNKNKNKNKGS